LDVALPPLCRRSGPDLSTSFVGSPGDALRRSSLPQLLPRREPSESTALQTSSASRETPPRAVDAHVIGAPTPSAPAAAKDITPWRFVGMVRTTLPQPPYPKPERSGHHRDDLIRMPDRGRCPITRSDQETMGLLDIFLVPSPQVRPGSSTCSPPRAGATRANVVGILIGVNLAQDSGGGSFCNDFPDLCYGSPEREAERRR
jgi:hypothetical protein